MNRLKTFFFGFMMVILTADSASSQKIHGTVTDNQGHTIAGVIVYAVENNARIRVDNNDVIMPERFPRVLSNSEGIFSFPPLKRPIKILLARDIEDRLAWITDPVPGKDIKMTIQEPASVTGQLLRGKSPIAKKEITAVLMTGTCQFSYRASVHTNEKGQFIFDSLPAGKYLIQTIDPVPQVGCCFRNVPTREAQAILKPAQSLSLQIGGSDLPWLHGKVIDTDGNPLHGVWVYLTSSTQKSVGIGSWSDTTKKDGTFAIYDVPPGYYTLHCFRRLALNNSSRTLQTTQPVTITDHLKPNSPAVPFAENVSNVSIDLAPFMPLEIGNPVPPLTKRVISGEEFTLENERGKIVVLHFYASWCIPCVKDFPNYDKLTDRFGSKRLTVISINLDETLDECRSFLQKQSSHHPQLFAGPWANSWAVKDFHIADVPSTIIVGPDGRIIQRDLFGDVLVDFIQKKFSLPLQKSSSKLPGQGI
jgi:thiol-disulfide isomerase/thioredoxin